VKSNTKAWLLILVTATFFFTSNLSPQGRWFWLGIKDDYAPSDSDRIFCGNFPTWTYAIDSLSPTCRELEFPVGDKGFVAKWVPGPGHAPGVWGGGIYQRDLRGYTDATRKDTFVVLFGNPFYDTTDVNFVITWPDSCYLKNRCDSMFLVDPGGALIPASIDMFGQDSIFLHVTQPLLYPIKFRIYVYGSYYPDHDSCEIPPGLGNVRGACPVAGILEDHGESVPMDFALAQNFPNPFNPETEFRFRIARFGAVKLKVYDLMGREVAKVVDENLSPGDYARSWNPVGFASGVYYYRLQSGESVDVKKLILLK
jgi:hypothetical protein